MVDRLVSCDEGSATCVFEVHAENVFFENGHLSPSGLVENIAQTCAAGIGYKNIHSDGAMKIGVIGAIGNLNIFRLPRQGELLTTTVEFMEEVLQITMFKAVVKNKVEVLASAVIKTALTDVDAQ